jgi:thioredoxin-related protein
MTNQNNATAIFLRGFGLILPAGRRTWIQWIALAFVLLLGMSTAKAEGFWDDSFYDMPNDLKQAVAEHKTGVFLFFQMADCPFCHRMETTVFTDPAVIAYMKKNFITASIDIEGDVMMTDFAGKQMTQKDFAFKQFRVRATPVMAFIDTQGKVATLFTGPTRSPEEFLSLAEFVISGAYKEPGMNFFKYRQQNTK